MTKLADRIEREWKRFRDSEEFSFLPMDERQVFFFICKAHDAPMLNKFEGGTPTELAQLAFPDWDLRPVIEKLKGRGLIQETMAMKLHEAQ